MRPDSLLLTPAQRRKERQRTRIIDVATDLYKENGGSEGGFEATTVEDIAERADISIRTFFRYFESKADVVFLDKQRAVEDLTDLTARQLRDGTLPAVALLQASFEQLDWFMQDAGNRQRIKRSLQAAQFRDRLAAWRDQERRSLSDLIQQTLHSEPLSHIHARIITTTIRDVFHVALEAWADSGVDNVHAWIVAAFERVPVMAADIATALASIEGLVAREAKKKPKSIAKP